VYASLSVGAVISMKLSSMICPLSAKEVFLFLSLQFSFCSVILYLVEVFA